MLLCFLSFQPAVFEAVMAILIEAKQADPGANIPKPLSYSRQQLLELVQLLEPLAEATDFLQSDGVTSSAVIPSIIGIHTGKHTMLSQKNNILPVL